jgi:tetratricopeptide (TPR) repeat protein
LGEATLAAGNRPQPLLDFKKAAALAPDNPDVLWRYGHALLLAGDHSAADKVLAKVGGLRRTGSGPPADSSAIMSLDSRGQSSVSLDALRELAASYPANWQLKFQMGEELLAERKAPEALEVFEQIKDSGDGGIAAAECGRALLRAGQYHAAREFEWYLPYLVHGVILAYTLQGARRLAH